MDGFTAQTRTPPQTWQPPFAQCRSWRPSKCRRSCAITVGSCRTTRAASCAASATADAILDSPNRCRNSLGGVLLNVVVGVRHLGEVRRREVALPSGQNRRVSERRVLHRPDQLQRPAAEYLRSLGGQALEHGSCVTDLPGKFSHTTTSRGVGLCLLVALQNGRFH